VIASLELWIAVGVLGAILIAGAAGLFLLLAMGRLCLDLGWGRSVHQLGPITVRIAAPQDQVFETIRAPYASRTPRHSPIEVLARGDGLAIAAHYTKVHFYTARTVEVIEFEPPRRVAFRHLLGPVPHAVEEFVISEADGVTEVRYGGEIGIDFFALGRIAGRYWVRPQWERTVRDHLEDLKRRVERQAGRPSPEPGEAMRGRA
jgi:hypothetical protein